MSFAMTLRRRTYGFAGDQAGRSAQSGFTLIEIMVVVTIIGMLAALIVPAVMGQSEKAKRKVAKTEVAAIASACDAFKLDMGRYPNSLNELITGSGEDWGGPYIKGKKEFKDPWKNEYAYAVINNGKEVQVTSTGGESGTAISNIE